MQHAVNFKAGETVFIPRIYSNGEHTTAVILSVGRKYAKAVRAVHHNTEDEKEMTFNINLATLETALTGNHIHKVYQSKEQHDEIANLRKESAIKRAKLTQTKWSDVSTEKIDQILAILEG